MRLSIRRIPGSSRKVAADVAEPRRAEQCIAQGMNDDVAVGVGGEPAVESMETPPSTSFAPAANR